MVGSEMQRIPQGSAIRPHQRHHRVQGSRYNETKTNAGLRTARWARRHRTLGPVLRVSEMPDFHAREANGWLPMLRLCHHWRVCAQNAGRGGNGLGRTVGACPTGKTTVLEHDDVGKGAAHCTTSLQELHYQLGHNMVAP